MTGQIERAARGGGDGKEAQVWRIVDRQHGVITRDQLLGLGFTRHAIHHRLETGRLHPLAAGVYAVGRPELSGHGTWLAAVLSCGRDAMLSHGSAAALWGVAAERGRIEITVRIGSPRRRPGLWVYRRPTLAERDVTTRKEIPVTGIVQTLVDLAATMRAATVERAVNEADRLDHVDPSALRIELESHRCEPGVRPLRDLLDRRTFRLTRSELERLFLPLVAAAELPRPLTNHRVNGFEVDFFWPQLGLVVETDGLRYHRTPTQQAKDRLRDQTHAAAGLTPLRFTHAQVRDEPEHVRRTLATVAARLGQDRPRPAPTLAPDRPARPPRADP